MTSRMFALSPALALLFLASAPALAQAPASPAIDPARIAAAQELADVLDLKAMMRSTNEVAAGQIEGQIMGMLVKSDPEFERMRAKDPAKFDAMTQRVAKVVAEEFRALIAEMEPDSYRETLAVYARVYTTDELRGITDFYRSPLGAKLLAKQPEVVRESLAMSQRLLADRLPVFLPRMKTRLTREFEALQGSGKASR